MIWTRFKTSLVGTCMAPRRGVFATYTNSWSNSAGSSFSLNSMVGTRALPCHHRARMTPRGADSNVRVWSRFPYSVPHGLLCTCSQVHRRDLVHALWRNLIVIMLSESCQGEEAKAGRRVPRNLQNPTRTCSCMVYRWASVHAGAPAGQTGDWLLSYRASYCVGWGEQGLEV